ncbi:unnamed protein product [Plutella xylostella]|uniref:(diamondback moth) hypothetical protein n=1 Tax=Plutella xylostella TaxID=51655 RepID=A0A8S4GCC6_PLUXY|nr:unnamed protein product [Plutella xylostella]
MPEKASVIKTRQGRKKQHATILTSTPQKENLLEKEINKMKKKGGKKKRKHGKVKDKEKRLKYRRRVLKRQSAKYYKNRTKLLYQMLALTTYARTMRMMTQKMLGTDA